MITAESLAASVFGVATRDNSYLWFAGMTDADIAEHNRLAVSFCAAFLDVYGDVYDDTRHRVAVADVISSARHSSDDGVNIGAALRTPNPYEQEHGREKRLDLVAAMARRTQAGA